MKYETCLNLLSCKNEEIHEGKRISSKLIQCHGSIQAG